MLTVDNRICGLAIDHCDPYSFERFINAFYADIVEVNFVPLGGTHDGGADGFEDAIFETEARSTSFLQASKSADVTTKIRKNIKRLNEFGREVREVVFYFSQPVPNIDRVEEALSMELDVAVRIRGKSYTEAHINHSAATVTAFNSYLADSVSFLNKIGSVGQQRHYPFDARTLCAF